MNTERARKLFGLDATETFLMTHSLDELVRRLVSDARATVPPPPRGQK